MTEEERDLAEEAALRLGHDHPLMLIRNEETEDSWDLTCYGCEQPISGSSSDYYGCKRCLFFLHKTCAQLPHQMTHPSHPLHPLTLIIDPRTLNYGGRGVPLCDICDEGCQRFTYHCSLCNYDIDMKCAFKVLSIQQSILHKSHPHKLIPLLQESMFLCAACGKEHQGTSFLCTTCGFWINQKCASSPLTLKLNNDCHHHTLSLVYFIPQENDKCRICSEELCRRSWAYSCSECCYFVHLPCAVSDKEHSTNNETEAKELDSSNSVAATSDADLSKVPTVKIKAQEPIIDLPMPDNSVDILTHFIKNNRIQGKYKEAAEIEHFSHDHPLTYFEKPIDPPASRSTKNLSSLLNGARNAEKCNGCAQSISAPFYRCVECNFLLHVWCAELPDKLRHPCHPDYTLSKFTIPTYALCWCCNILGNVLFYSCSQNCNFFLDSKCASLPRVIKHEAHKHNLALRPTPSVSTCISCGIHSRGSYECGGCKHYLCVRCAFLPRTIRHRYDKLHPFTLTYSRLTYQREDDFCEICEEEIDSNHWFYHCRECNRYLHTECIFPANIIANIVYGHTVKTTTHPHRLTCIKPTKDLLCSVCNSNDASGDAVGYLCSTCKFFLCVRCRLHNS